LAVKTYREWLSDRGSGDVAEYVVDYLVPELARQRGRVTVGDVLEALRRDGDKRVAEWLSVRRVARLLLISAKKHGLRGVYRPR